MSSESPRFCKDVFLELSEFSWSHSTRLQRMNYLQSVLSSHEIGLSDSFYDALKKPNLRNQIFQFWQLRRLDKKTYSAVDIENLTDFFVGTSLKLRYPKLLSILNQSQEREFFSLYQKAVVQKGLAEAFSSLGLIKKNSPPQKVLQMLKPYRQKWTLLFTVAVDLVSVHFGQLPPLAPLFERSLSSLQKEIFINRASEVGFEKAFTEIYPHEAIIGKTKARTAYQWLAKTYSLMMSLTLIATVPAQFERIHEQQQFEAQKQLQTMIEDIQDLAMPRTLEEQAELHWQSFVQSQLESNKNFDPHSPENEALHQQIIAATIESQKK